MTDKGQDSPEEMAGTLERAQRIRTLKGAYAAFNHEFSVVPCTIKEESETGAKLQFDDAWWAPDTFTLVVEIDGYKVECEKVWHQGHLYGVRFTGEKTKIGMGRRQTVQMLNFNNSSPVDGSEQKQVSDFANGPRKKSTGPTFGKLGR